MYYVTRFIIWPKVLWLWFDKSNRKNGGTKTVVDGWYMISQSTGFYWYNKVGIVVTLMFGVRILSM